MLVHKHSCGVLYSILVFSDQKTIGPSNVYKYKKNLTLKDFPELDPNEWYEINDSLSLAKKIRMYYPNFTIIEKDGKIVDIEIIKDENKEVFHKKRKKKQKRICHKSKLK